MIEVANFVILTRTSRDLQQHAPNTEEYTHVAHAIATALNILLTSRARRCLVQLTLRFDAWRFGGANFRGDPRQAEAAVDLFLRKIWAIFPPVVIDETMTHPDNLASHPRGVWSGPFENFQPRDQMIFINGQKVYNMIAAVRSSSQQAAFRQFQFLFSTTLVHEIGGHLLITYLGHGSPETPTEMNVAGYTQAEDKGESGRYLSYTCLGEHWSTSKGPTKICTCASLTVYQTGIPHIVDAHQKIWRLDESAIGDLVKWSMNFSHSFDIDNDREYPLTKPDFTLPLRITGNQVVDRHRMRTMGHGIPIPAGYLDARPMLAGRISDAKRRHLLSGFNIRLRDVRMVASNPRRLLKAC